MSSLLMTDFAWLDRVARELTLRAPFGEWTFTKNGDGTYFVLGWLDASNGMKIAVQRRSPERATWQPIRPDVGGLPGDDRLNVRHVPMPDAITVKWGRDPNVVADDMRRRLLPSYKNAIALYLDAVSEARAQLAGKGATEKRLTQALNGLSRVEHANALIGRGMHPSPEFKVSYDGTEVDVELRWCPADLAVEIAELLQRHYESEGET